ncbi:MAG: (d)CMP kinase [Flavobacteriales bacterium]|nr:(d)CMP kinase [Flavobacteriales bacterium]
MRRITIAIDGFSSCGKSTLAKQLAHHLGYTYIDSGAMYRAVALFAMESGLVKDHYMDLQGLVEALDGIRIGFQHDDSTGRSATFLNGRNVEGPIRGMEVSRHVTLVSPVPEVRAKLVELQRALGSEGGVVMDGRDIGTVVFPHAEVKFFMTASPEIRAQRRYQELVAKGVQVDIAAVRENIARRDEDDTRRKASPLVQAPDAIVIDNSDLTEEEQFQLALGHVMKVIGEPEEVRARTAR